MVKYCFNQYLIPLKYKKQYYLNVKNRSCRNLIVFFLYLINFDLIFLQLHD